MINKIDILEGSLYDYYCNNCIAEEVLNKAGITPTEDLIYLINSSQEEWEAISCDQEGANVEQETIMKEHITNLINHIIG